MASVKLQTLTQFWQGFDLPMLQSQLDTVATEITSRQDESEASRRALIERMRDFKRTSGEDVRMQVAPMVKSFQNEVDSLSKRSKAAEKAFFDVYKRLADVANPVPVLEHALESQKSLSKLQDFEIETRQLRETIGDYNKEIQEYKVKEKKLNELQAKVDAYDRNIDQTLNVRIKDVTDQMLDEYNDKLKAIEEEKVTLEKKNTDLEARWRAAQKQLNDAQGELYEALSKKEGEHNAKTEEVDMLFNDLEVSQQRAASAEREVEMLKEKLEQASEGQASAAAAAAAAAAAEAAQEAALQPNLARELSAKEREVAQLMSDVQTVREEKREEEQRLQRKIDDDCREIAELGKMVQSLEAKLQRQADYDSIKKDLSILKTLEFGQQQQHQEGEDGADDGANELDKKPLEVVILERSKVLQSENTSLRVEKDRLAGEMVSVKREATDRAREMERQQTLIAELEDHVERLQELTAVNARGEAEGRSSADILVDALDFTGAKAATPLTPSPQQLLQPGESDAFELAAPSAPADSSSSSSKAALLPIVQAQRERFRQRNEELEETQSKQLQQMALLQTEVKDMQADNVKLYEKIRFLQGFSQKDHRSGGGENNIESRYKSHYEQKMDPFNSFSHQERQRRYGQLNVFEKILLFLVQFMMSNKLARLFALAYSVLLHVLVFAVLMKLAYHDAYRRDIAAEWHEKYMRHMEDVHGHEDEHGT